MLATALMLAKAGLGRALNWLASLNLAQAGCLILAGLCLYLYIGRADARGDERKALAALEKCVRAQKKLEEESARRKEQTGKVIERYIRVEKPKADRDARRVETAKLPGNCRTPDEVRSADL